MAEEASGLVQGLLGAFAKAGVGEDCCRFDRASGQLVVMGTVTRVVPVPALLTRYSSCSSEEEREAVISAAAEAFVSGASDVPSRYEDCGQRLLPQLWPAEKIAARQATLPGSVRLPHCGVHGEEPPLNGVGLGELGVVLVCEYVDGAVGGSSVLPPIEMPVLSTDLNRWGVSFATALGCALENLRNRTKAGPPAAERWEHHPSGCGQSAQCDRFDSARCALLPKLVALRKRHDGVPEQGGHVVAFATSSCVLATTSKNPLGLCFMGDTLHLRIAKEDAGSTQCKLLSATPFRLLKMRESCVAEGMGSHPLTQKASDGFVWRWAPYVPGGPPLRSEGEFSVPVYQSEVDAILNAAEAGSKIPVFARAEAPPVDTGKQFASKKEEANSFFKAGEFVKALAAYDAALALRPPSDRDAAVVHANAAQALLKLAAADGARRDACAAEAFLRAHQATQLDPSYAKAHARVAAAAELLGEEAAAAEAHASADVCAKEAASASAAAKMQVLEEAEEKRKALEAKRAVEEAARRRRAEREALLAREQDLERQKQQKEAVQQSGDLYSMLGLDPKLGGLGIGVNTAGGLAAGPPLLAGNVV